MYNLIIKNNLRPPSTAIMLRTLKLAKNLAQHKSMAELQWKRTDSGFEATNGSNTYFSIEIIEEGFKAKLRSIMNTKWDDYFIQTLIVISLILLPIETIKSLTTQQLLWLHTIDKMIVIIFTIEYAIRFYLDGRKFAFSIHGLIDLLAIAPYYLALGVGFQSIRVFRLFRLVRMLKLIRYTSALDRLIAALKIAKDELMIFSFITMGVIYLAAVGIYYFENVANPEMYSDIFRSLWWAVITLTTIGYGDIYPVTVGGQLLTIILALTGLGIVAIPTSIMSSALTEVRIQEKEEKI